MNLVLHTSRLTLREIQDTDAGWIVAWRSDPKVYQYFLNPHPITLREHRNWYSNSYKKNKQRIDLFAVDNNTGEAIGVFGLIKQAAGLTEINYLLDDLHQGKGYAVEAVTAIIDWAAENWNTRTIIAEIHKENIDSLHLVQKLGFHEDTESGMFIIYQKELE